MSASAVQPNYEGEGQQNDIVVCYRPYPINSRGIWVGDNPLHFSFPLIMLQISLVIFITRFIQILLKPLKQPKVVSEIMGGILLGPSFLGRYEAFSNMVYPVEGSMAMGTFMVLGMMFFGFFAGVKNDPNMVIKAGRKGWVIAISSLFATFTSVTIISLLSNSLSIDLDVRKTLPYISVSLAVSGFITVVPILDELKLLNSEIGQLSVSTCLIIDTGASVFVVILTLIKRTNFSMLTGILYLVSYCAVVTVTVCLIRPLSMSIIRRTSGRIPVKQDFIVTILLIVMINGCMCDFVGSDLINGAIINGALILGLAMPDGPPLGSAIVEKSESILVGMLLPLFYTISGIKVNVFGIHDWKKWAILQLIVVFGHVSKLVGTIMPCLYYKMPIRDALSFGLIMLFRGPSEIIAFSQWRLAEVIDEPTYTTLILSTMAMTAISTPLVRYLCKPWKPLVVSSNNKGRLQTTRPNDAIRMLACVHTPDNVLSIISLLEALHATKESPFCIYVFHLLELVGRFVPKIIAHEKDKKILRINTIDRSIINAFEIYEKRNRGRVSTHPFTTMSSYDTMHKDICRIALEESISLIIVPYHKQRAIDGELSKLDTCLRTVNSNILIEAPCSVGILMDRGIGDRSHALVGRSENRVAAIFLGGPDDREALIYAFYMIDNQNVTLTILRLLPLEECRGNELERLLDEELVRELRLKNASKQNFSYIEKILKDSEQTITFLHSIRDLYTLIIVGRKQEKNSMLIEGLMGLSESLEFGGIGDFLASSDFRGTTSVFVIQQVDVAEDYNKNL